MTNHLIHETSPYLLQHAGNPVDWHPWRRDALDRAAAEGRPILLSIGYSACHWCHVMERESFEDPEIAALMNERFVNIKVDREERPDIDQIYMNAVQALTGRGGWPLTVFLTPDGRPFYGGTYFPPEPRHGMPSFRQVLEAVSDAYASRPGEVAQAAARLLEAMSPSPSAEAESSDELPKSSLVDDAIRTLEGAYDPVHGGFGRAPKFPQPAVLELLLRYHARTGAARPLEMALHTLRRMAAGGMRDHVGGGFHRYSVDDRWLVPHFEKMLYDNALLARAYLDAFRATGAADLARVAVSTLEYVLADLTAPQGGFYSARDADSEGEEGLFYLWTPTEVDEVLDAPDAELVRRHYDITPAGNFEGRSIPHPVTDVHEEARRAGVAPDALRARLARARAAMAKARARRVPPRRDEKILASWNGLAIRTLAAAGITLGRTDFLSAARRAMAFIDARMRPGGALCHVWAAGRAHVPAFLADHGAIGNAALTLHEATLEPEWLAAARSSAEEALVAFWSEEDGIFHDTRHDAEPLVARPREITDGAIPSGTSLALELLIRLGTLLEEERYLAVARRALASSAGMMRRYPAAFGRLLSCLHRAHAAPAELVIVGPPERDDTETMLRTAWEGYRPDLVVTGGRPGDGGAHAQGFAQPLLEGRTMIDGHATAYVCRDRVCGLPLSTPAALGEALSDIT